MNRQLIFLSAVTTFALVSFTFHFNALKQEKESQVEKLLRHVKAVSKDVRDLKSVFESHKQWSEYVWYRKQEIRGLHISSRLGRTLVTNPHVVSDNVKVDCKTKYKLIVLVSSHVEHFKKRRKIRSSWGNTTMWTFKESWKIIFVLGAVENPTTLKRVKDEGDQFSDILLEDIKESYYKLAFKVMVGLHWTISTVDFEFVLKCDDDVFVQMDKLFVQLNTTYKDQHYVGHVMDSQPVYRKGRYALTESEHEDDYFAPYCSGGGLLLSKYAVSETIPLFDWHKPLKIDDAYIGLLIRKTDIQPYHVSHGFYMWNTWCEYNKYLIVSHPVNRDKCLVFLKYRSLIDNGKMENEALRNITYGLPPENS